VERYQSLVGKGFASQQKNEEAKATYGALQGTIRAAEAAIEAVKLQLEYSAIRSPIDGRTGSLLVNTGNLVKGNDTQPLVVITQLKPIYVTFSVPERYLARVKTLMATTSVAVEARIPGSAAAPTQGRLVFVNNAVDTNTGTIQLKATFENAQYEFTSGQFVNVAMTLEERPNALVIPSQALQEGQRGSYVFVMKEDRTVEMRSVAVDDTVGDFTVIASGLAAGEDVVLDGQMQLRPGARVSVRSPDGQPQRGGAEGARPERKRPDGAGGGEERRKRRPANAGGA
jgi:multidrug efflux system membrane fusion protein